MFSKEILYALTLYILIMTGLLNFLALKLLIVCESLFQINIRAVYEFM